jgi:adenylate cyclase
MARLIATTGGNRGNEYAVVRSPSVLGRHEESDIVVLDRRASRRHAQIEKVGEKYYVEDLASRNGTYVNDEAVTRSPLKDGDEITICDTKFIFRDEAAKTLSATVSKMDSAAALRRSMVTLLPDAGGPQQSVNAAMDVDVPFGLPTATTAGRIADAGQRARNSLRTIWSVANALVTKHDLQELLEEVMNQLFQIFPQADRGFVMLKEEGTAELVAKVIRSRGQKPGELVEIHISSGVVNEIMTKRKAVLSTDAQSDERFSDRLSIVNFQIRSMIAAPLIVRSEILGLIHIDTTSRSQGFTEQDLELLTSIAPQVAVAIKNAQLVKQVEQEAERRSGLQRYLSPDLVDLIMKNEINLAPGGRACSGTAFFSDIIGFTRMSERMSPNDVVEKLNKYFHVMEEIIFRRGGTIDKFGGDSIMAFWGVLVEREHSVLDAVTAAIEMQNALFSLNLVGGNVGHDELRMGIGLNTGDLVAGNIGSEQKVEYTVIGDSVNVASRIESKAGRGQVFIGESTFRGCARDVAAIRLPAVEVKNKSGPVQIYCVRAVRPSSGGEGAIVSLPVSVDAGTGACEGLVVWAKAVGKQIMCEVCSKAVPREGSTATITPSAREKPTLPPVTGSVIAARATNGPGSWLMAIKSPPKEFVSVITPGNAVPADISSSQLVRE